MQQRLPSLLPRPLLFAHRGARADARENTMEAFELAIAKGATGIESDVWITVDGLAVLDHDGQVGSWRKKRPIGTLRRDELPAHIPALSDVLGLLTGGLALSLDIKDPAGGPVVLATLDRHDAELVSRTWLCHPSLDVLRSLRVGRNDVRLVHSTRLARLTEGPERHAARLADDEIDAVNLRNGDWNGGLAALYHRFDRFAFGWDYQHPHEIVPALRMGLDAVYSDYVDRMVAAAKASALDA